MYSATKHIDGQGRVLGGAILGTKKDCDVNTFIKPFIRNTGPSISPFNAWVLLKGIETLELKNKKTIMIMLKKSFQLFRKKNFINKIYYPTDTKFKQRNLAKKQMKGGGSIISFELNP